MSIQHAIDTALGALDGLDAVLLELTALLTTLAGNARAVALATPQEQRHIDEAIDRCDTILARATFDAAPMFSGRFSIPSPQLGADATGLTLPPLASSELGDDDVGGRLDSLRAGQPNAPSAFCAGRARAVVLAARLQVHAAREQLQNFASERLEPARAELDIASANLACADGLASDDAFLAAAAQLTPMHALCAAQASPPAPADSFEAARHILRISRTPPSHKNRS